MKDYLIAATTNKQLLSLIGLGATILAALKVISIVFGAAGAVLAFTAGVIAMLQGYHKYKKETGKGFWFYFFKS